jgi:hypothetical protein
MTSFLAKLFGSTPKLPAKPITAAAPQKSAARLANERNILEARRTILANMARIENNPTAKEKVKSLIDADTDRASQVVRNILLSQERK